MFHKRELFILIKSSLLVISFMDCPFGVVSKKKSPNPRSSRLSPMSFSKSFIVTHYTLRFMVHFELIIVKGVRSVSRFIILHVDAQFFQYRLLQLLSFLHGIPFAPLSKINWLYLCWSISGLYSIH